MTGRKFDNHGLVEVRRTHYFDGQLLTAADFARDQQYQRDMRYLHNRALGFGIVEGLDVHPSPNGLTITPGFAIDDLGREIVVPHAVKLALDETLVTPGCRWPSPPRGRRYSMARRVSRRPSSPSSQP